MPVQEPDVIERLRAANPAAVEQRAGDSPVARAGLERILDEPAEAAGSPRGRVRRRRGRLGRPRGLAIVLLALIVGGGAAFAATDPLGWWSRDPTQARYRLDPTQHVRTPTQQAVRCEPVGGGSFRCAPHGRGQRYEFTDAVQSGITGTFTRRTLTAGIAKALVAHQITPALAARFRADLKAVPDSFFTLFQAMSRYATVGGGYDTAHGRTLVPPPGVPSFLACVEAGAALACRDLNGDLNVPVGAGEYDAVPNRGWRSVPTPRTVGGQLPPGVHLTNAEYRLLYDLLATATGRSSSSSGSSRGG